MTSKTDGFVDYKTIWPEFQRADTSYGSGKELVGLFLARDHALVNQVKLSTQNPIL